MTSIAAIPAGTKFDTVQVTGPAPSKGGAAHWSTACTACGREASVRGTVLRSGTYQCRCQKPASAPRRAQAAAPETLVELLDSYFAEHTAKVLAAVSKLLAQASPPPASTGLKKQSLVAARPQIRPYTLSRDTLLEGAKDKAERAERFDQNLAKIVELADAAKVEDANELASRLVVELEYCQNIQLNDPKEAARRLDETAWPQKVRDMLLDESHTQKKVDELVREMKPA